MGKKLFFVIRWFLPVISVIVLNPANFEQALAQQALAATSEPITKIPQLSDVEHPITSAEVLVQSPTPSAPSNTVVVPVTEVKVNTTNKGLDIILTTPDSISESEIFWVACLNILLLYGRLTLSPPVP